MQHGWIIAYHGRPSGDGIAATFDRCINGSLHVRIRIYVLDCEGSWAVRRWLDNVNWDVDAMHGHLCSTCRNQHRGKLRHDMSHIQPPARCYPLSYKAREEI